MKVGIRRVAAAAVDEMWSSVGKKKEPRGLWHAIDHDSGAVLAYVFGRRQDAVLQEVQQLLPPFGSKRFYPDHWGADARQLASERHSPGKRPTQKSERKQLTLRMRIKRLARKTSCFSNSVPMHDLVIGLFVNRYEFGLGV